MRRWLIYLGILVFGALVLSQVIALMGFDPMPGDVNYDRENWHIHIPVLYSLGASAVLALLFSFMRR
ncbi:MAG TPA: DUF2905 family protein [Rhizomicrobium sp.]